MVPMLLMYTCTVIGSDAQSILKALKVGPHRPYHYIGVDTSLLWKRMYEIMTFCKELVIQYIPGHIDIEGNTYADNSAKHDATHYTTIQQNEIAPSLSNLKSYLQRNLFEQWCIDMNSKLTPNLRSSLLQFTTSRLKLKTNSPRPFQTLFSRY